MEIDFSGPALRDSISRQRESGRISAAPISAWTNSRAKRLFDLVMVLAAAPFLAPLCLLVALAIRMSSKGPVFFVQKRAGVGGRLFPIVKFRTMVATGRANGSITTIDDEQITGLGRVLRHWKLDELPQLWNVVRGDMSLVGPRPLVPEQQFVRFRCRPGITGAASLAFAREEVLLAAIPRHQLATYYASRVLPIKQRIDDAYMGQAGFFSDVKMLVKTVIAVWTPGGEAVEATNELSAKSCGIADVVLPGEGCD